MELTAIKNQQTGILSASLPVFEANQILSSKHLNDLRDFLDQQDRLTRVRLIGQGIVGGFGVKLITLPETGKTVEVDAGIAITSEGHLIESVARKLSHYRKYNDSTDYDLFQTNIGLQKKQISLWELVEEEGIVEGEEHLYSPIDGNTSLFLDKTVIMFLEVFDEDQKSCFTFSCDGKGLKRVYNIRVLVIENNVLDKWMQSQFDLSSSTDLELFVNGFLRLPSTSIKRLQLYKNKDAIDFSGYNEMALAYKKLIDAFVKDADQIIEAINKIITLRFPDFKLLSGIAAFIEKQMQSNFYNIQYIYDFCKDLNETIVELTSLIQGFLKNHSLAEENFPKHLMLGELIVEGEPGCEPTIYRNHFKRALVNFPSKELLEKITFYIEKTHLLISNFDVRVQAGTKIKITPDNLNPLSKSGRSLPYYYQPILDDKILYKYWNYELAKNCSAEKTLSYWSAKYTTDPYVKTPLNFNVDHYGMVRIEGHIGKSLEIAEETIEDYRTTNNLPFKLVTLTLKAEIDLGDYSDDFNFDFHTRKKNVNKKSFLNFVRKHTGIEHIGGVQKGGTFVLVYEETVVDKDIQTRVVADFALPYMVDFSDTVIKTDGDFNNDFNNDFTINE